MSHNDNIKIKFSGNDFFYVNAVMPGGEAEPTDDNCETLKTGNNVTRLSVDKCIINSRSDSDWLTDLSGDCYKKEVCQNKEKALKLNDLENNHSGRDQNFINSQNIYSLELRRSIALSLGLIILFGSIIYSKK